MAIEDKIIDALSIVKSQAFKKIDDLKNVVDTEIKDRIANNPSIEDGTWHIGGNDTGIPVTGKDGKDGKDGINGRDGKDGKNGRNGEDGKNGLQGPQGIAGRNGKDGRDGKDGKDGLPGKDGKDGTDGLDAYQIAVKEGFKGTRKEWLKSLEGYGNIVYKRGGSLPVKKSRTLTYNGDGMIATITDTGGTQTFTYDAESLPTVITGTGDYSTQTFTWSDGMITAITVS